MAMLFQFWNDADNGQQPSNVILATSNPFRLFNEENRASITIVDMRRRLYNILLGHKGELIEQEFRGLCTHWCRIAVCTYRALVARLLAMGRMNQARQSKIKHNANRVAITIGGSNGHFQLNIFKTTDCVECLVY